MTRHSRRLWHVSTNNALYTAREFGWHVSTNNAKKGMMAGRFERLNWKTVDVNGEQEQENMGNQTKALSTDLQICTLFLGLTLVANVSTVLFFLPWLEWSMKCNFYWLDTLQLLRDAHLQRRMLGTFIQWTSAHWEAGLISQRRLQEPTQKQWNTFQRQN